MFYWIAREAETLNEPEIPKLKQYDNFVCSLSQSCRFPSLCSSLNINFLRSKCSDTLPPWDLFHFIVNMDSINNFFSLQNSNLELYCHLNTISYRVRVYAFISLCHRCFILIGRPTVTENHRVTVLIN